MRGLWRDKDFLLVAGCLVAGVLQVRTQRRLLRSLEARHRRQTAVALPHRTHQPMTYSADGATAKLNLSPLAAAFGMN